MLNNAKFSNTRFVYEDDPSVRWSAQIAGSKAGATRAPNATQRAARKYTPSRGLTRGGCVCSLLLSLSPASPLIGRPGQIARGAESEASRGGSCGGPENRRDGSNERRSLFRSVRRKLVESQYSGLDPDPGTRSILSQTLSNSSRDSRDAADSGIAGCLAMLTRHEAIK